MSHKFTRIRLTLFRIFIVDYYPVPFEAEMTHVLRRTFLQNHRKKSRKKMSITTDHHLYQQSRRLLFLFITDSFPVGMTFVLFALIVSDVVTFHLALPLKGNCALCEQGVSGFCACLCYLSRPPLVNQSLCYYKDLSGTPEYKINALQLQWFIGNSQNTTV